MARGNIQVHTENIFPIIKKWLYSDKDIFIRELVSNGCDAVVKLKKLGSIGEAKLSENEKFAVTVKVDKENKRLIFSDNGIGMTADEIEKYITQVAFSGAEEFLSHVKDKSAGEGDIIGHFGLGFYSAFMVAGTVEIETLSHVEGAKPANWSCDGGTEYELVEGTKTTRGTDIILNLTEENEELLDTSKIGQILNKYCSFLPVEIFLDDGETKQEDGKPINDTQPLWLKKPSECTDEEYKEFYSKVFSDFNPPLFWIHLNVDYPFNLKGILYFPKLRHELDSIEGQIKLYNNQVFVADNIKEVIPEYLMLLKGAIDCPDLPLNVSRSFLQNDGYVKKVSAHITKKVADKLSGMFNTSREDFEKYWTDISPFVKYACMRDDGFYDKVKDALLFKTIDGNFVTVKEYLEKAESTHKGKIYYASNEQQQGQYISLFKEQGLDAVVLPHAIDNHFISFLEMKNSEVKFERIDSSIAEHLKSDDLSQSFDELVDVFKGAINDSNIKIEAQKLKTDAVPAILTLSEQSRRMQEMSAMFGGGDFKFPEEKTLVVNASNPVVIALMDKKYNSEYTELVCKQIYDLAQLGHSPLDSSAMTAFIERSSLLLSKLSNN